MKAALEAWGSKQNLFHQGFAKETDDGVVVAAAMAAAMAKPGIVLRRPVGSDQPFREHADLPTIESLILVHVKAKLQAKKHRRRQRLTKRELFRPHMLTNENGSGGKGSARKKRLQQRRPARAVTRLCQMPRRRSNPQGGSTRQPRPRLKRIARRSNNVLRWKKRAGTR